MKMHNSWEKIPTKDDTYFIIDHCGKKGILSFKEGGWKDVNGNQACPTCFQFQWLDLEDAA